MYTNEVQWQAGYEQFHTSGRTGKKLLHVENSTFDSVIGRDIGHCSGETPRESNTGRFKGLAGKPSQPKPEVPFRKPGVSMTSTMDSTIWGRDMDESGTSPHDDFLKSYATHAGRPAGFQPMLHHEHRPSRKGAYSMKSTMDETLFGRDLDFSGSDPHDHFENTYREHAGVRSANHPDRPFRKPTCAMQASADEVIFGLDTDRSGPNPQKEHMKKNYGAHAGLKTGERVERPYRRNGISAQATVDDVVFHHDVDFSGEAPQTDLFARVYHDHAGKLSEGGPRTVMKQVDPRDPSFGKAKKGAGATGTTLASTRQPMSARAAPTSDAGSRAGSWFAEGPQMSGAGGSTAGSSLSKGRHAQSAQDLASEAGTSDYGVSVASRSSSWVGGHAGARPRSSCASSSAAGGERPRWR